MTTPRVTVPVEPTDEMIEVLRDWYALQLGRPITKGKARKVLRRVLSAAPAPEGGAVDDLRRLLGDAICYGCSRRYGDNSEAAIKDARGCVSCKAARSALATREEAPEWTARTEAAWAENNSEDAQPDTDCVSLLADLDAGKPVGREAAATIRSLTAERPAPDALRVAVEALEYIDNNKSIAPVWVQRRVRQALAALQAEQGAK